ncbi:lectin-like domain-containing protein [Secundilactobacillus pentosiphilus]|uniref:lectin-like domain-containing protein n=1 Tax=Secundilactobacillus pentosiphilus TaxID=1714682 RepID=UPI001CDA8586|nr:LPXTG cell wall anchor domain-containing protein [Secundilactobacillus pentosiphilus]
MQQLLHCWEVLQSKLLTQVSQATASTSESSKQATSVQNSSSSATSSASTSDSSSVNAPSTSQQGEQNANSTSVTAPAKNQNTPAAPITLSPEQVEQAFETHGNANFDSTKPGTVTLTDKAGNQQGSVTLKNKISLNQGFDLKGQINLGALDQVNHGGGDGIAFGFHDANSDAVGDGGAGLGLGGIPDAIGWKADTTFNWDTSNDATADPLQFSNGPQKPNSPGYGGGQAFGAFIESSKATGLPGDTPGTVSTTGVTSGSDSAQAIDTPSPGSTDNPEADPINWVGEFKPIEIIYDPNNDGKGKKTLTVKYDNKEWQKDITAWAADKTSTAFFISAGTAANRNLQQFRLDSFSYLPAATVDVKYVYTTDTTLITDPTAPVDPSTVKEIPNYVGRVNYPSGTLVGDPYITSPQLIKGYQYVRLYDGSLPAAGTLKTAGNNGTVTYLYVQNGNLGQVVNIKFWDKTENKLLQMLAFNGPSDTKLNYSDKAQVATYVKAGYAYDPRNDSTLGGIVFDHNNDAVQTFNVYLTHQTQSAQVVQTVTRTINYVKASDGSQLYEPSVTHLTFTRTDTTDSVTHTTTQGNWSAAQTFKAVTSPTTIPDYVPDTKIEPKLTVGLNSAVPTAKQLNLIVKYSIVSGEIPDINPHVWFKAQVPPAVHEPTGEVPDTNPHAWFKAQVPPAVHEPTGEVPDTNPHAWFKAQVPPAVHEPTGEVPDTNPHVWFKAQVPPAVHEPTGEVPDTNPHVWFKAQVPPAVFQPGGHPQTRSNVPGNVPIQPNSLITPPIGDHDTGTPITTTPTEDHDTGTPITTINHHRVTDHQPGHVVTGTDHDTGVRRYASRRSYQVKPLPFGQSSRPAAVKPATYTSQVKPTSTRKATTSKATTSKTTMKLPQTSEHSTSIWALFGFSLMSALSLLGFKQRKRHENN